MLRIVRYLLIAVGLMTGYPFLGISPSAAQDTQPAPLPSGDIVEAINVEGNQRIERETVLSYMLIKVGDPFSSSRMDRSLKSLFATGLFADVTLRRQVNTLVVRVVENPVINRIAFEGNFKLSDEDLAAEVQLRPRVVYTRTKVQNDVKRILELYRRNGRFGATVEAKAITLSQNRVDLVFEITEGETTGIDRIAFIGNRHFSDGELREVIVTSESTWWNFLTSSDTYDPDRLTFDRELLRRFYLNEGYADFRIISAVAELTPDKTGFFVTFSVDEGERYRFGTVAIESNIKGLSSDQLRERLTFEEGDWYDAEEIDKSITELTDEVGVLGFAFVEIRPDVQRDADTLTISVTLIINEGPRVFVERIDIVGNTRTLDHVIRREIQLVEGDPFNTQKLQRSRQRLQNLNFFTTVEVRNLPGSQPDTTRIEVAVEEQPTGELSLGAGFSTDDGPLATVGVSERNFLGRGQSMRASFAISGRTQQIDLSFTEPYFLGYHMSAGIDLFRISQEIEDTGNFDQESTGGALRLGYEIAEYWRQNIALTVREDNITNVDPGASQVIQLQAGRTLTSMIGQDIIYDTRDNIRNPTKGHFVSVGTDYAGLVAGANFARLRASTGWIFPIDEEWRLTLSGEIGTVVGIDEGVRIQHRFFKGGNDLRGFAVAGIGPRDSATDEALGGNHFYTGTVEMSFPLGLPESLGVEGKVFTDFGSLWGIDTNIATVQDVASLRASAGVGLQITTPFGPVRIDLAQAILKESFDKTQTIHFSFGTTF